MRCVLLPIILCLIGITPCNAGLTPQEIIQKARRQLGTESSLTVHSLTKDGNLFDAQGNKVAYVQLKIKHPNKRWEYSLSADGTIETINGTDGQEGFSKRVLVPQQNAHVRVLNGQERALLFDMTEADLGLYSSPRNGKIIFEGEQLQQGRNCYALRYAYTGGRQTRCFFDKDTFSLIAQEFLSSSPGSSPTLLVPTGEIIANGIRFPKQFTIYENDKKVGSVEYLEIKVNPDIPDNTFAFPLL